MKDTRKLLSKQTLSYSKIGSHREFLGPDFAVRVPLPKSTRFSVGVYEILKNFMHLSGVPHPFDPQRVVHGSRTQRKDGGRTDRLPARVDGQSPCLFSDSKSGK